MHLQLEVERHLNAIAAHWKPGAKLTLLVRMDTPESPGSQDALFTTDGMIDICGAITRLMCKPAEAAGEAAENG